MPRYFVIQPFDKGKFDKRYHDVFDPAIREAGLDPYRVDHDPTVSIPIEDIENGIRDAAVCFADITTDNPNVWFELGYAISSVKEICMICSQERTGKFPFDVQHRSVIKYSIESQSDFEKLKTQITDRLLAILKKKSRLAILSSQSPLKETEGLSQQEIIVLCAIMENRSGPSSAVLHGQITNDMEAIGYNRLAVNIGLAQLLKKNMIEATTEADDFDQEYDVYLLTEIGVDWLLVNEDKLNLKRSPDRQNKAPNDLDDEIPF